MIRNHLFGLIAACCALLSAGFAVAQANSAQTASASAPIATIEEYYDSVKDIFKKSAVMLGAAVGPARPPLINVQNHCSRSLGKLRAILRQARSGGAGAAVEALAASAVAPFEECRAAFATVSAG